MGSATATLITGTVAGFVLVIDPDNAAGLFDRIEFDEVAKLEQWKKEFSAEEDSENSTPQATFTMFRRADNGESEAEEGYDATAEVGMFAYKQQCSKCGKTLWSIFRDNELIATEEYRCKDCGGKITLRDIAIIDD